MTTKRIHSITIKRMIDTDPDTSYLGEYSNKPTSEYSIDRAHALDCPQQAHYRPTAIIDMLERAIDHIQHSDPDSDFYDSDACDLLREKQEELEECTCGFSGHWNNREFRYFNPSGNYNGDTPENIVKYTQQDYERMEGLNRGDWCYTGIRAHAEYSIGTTGYAVIQELASGGMWGVESDSDKEFIESVEHDELNELQKQLTAIGFGKRAIASAMKNIEHENN